MEKKHHDRIKQPFGQKIEDRPIIILEIADEYKLMDPVLIEEIKTAVEPYLEKFGG